MTALAAYLPPDTYEAVLSYLNHYKVHLTIAKTRNSILGDYRFKPAGGHHRISVNGSLNPYAFLITLLHELAHLVAFEQYGSRIAAHGKEWKSVYGDLLARFLQKDIFPTDIATELRQRLHNPGASTCAEEGLQRMLRRYDPPRPHTALIEELPVGSLFMIKGGRVFRRGEKRTKRYYCTELATNKVYLFSGVYEVNTRVE